MMALPRKPSVQQGPRAVKPKGKTTHQALMLQIVSQQLIEVHNLEVVMSPAYQEN